MHAQWKPLQQASLKGSLTEADVNHAIAISGLDYDVAKEALEREVYGAEYWINDLYQIAKRNLPPIENMPPMVHLCIRRRDGKPIFRDWRHFQWIKNQLVGDEAEAVELYPAESRLNDTSNKYHLWCFPPGYRIPFGMPVRDVQDDDGTRQPGKRQRKF